VRAILDTNVLLSGLLWRGAPHTLLNAVRQGSLNLVCSPTLLAELERVISRPKFDATLIRSQTSREQSLTQLRQLAEIIEPPPLPQPVCRDPDDDAVLAPAIAARPNCIVSGDDDLLTLRHYQSIPIVTPAQALELVETG